MNVGVLKVRQCIDSMAAFCRSWWRLPARQEVRIGYQAFDAGDVFHHLNERTRVEGVEELPRLRAQDIGRIAPLEPLLIPVVDVFRVSAGCESRPGRPLVTLAAESRRSRRAGRVARTRSGYGGRVLCPSPLRRVYQAGNRVDLGQEGHRSHGFPESGVSGTARIA